jgi:hypothetical protein
VSSSTSTKRADPGTGEGAQRPRPEPAATQDGDRRLAQPQLRSARIAELGQVRKLPVETVRELRRQRDRLLVDHLQHARAPERVELLHDGAVRAAGGERQLLQRRGAAGQRTDERAVHAVRRANDEVSRLSRPQQEEVAGRGGERLDRGQQAEPCSALAAQLLIT